MLVGAKRAFADAEQKLTGISSELQQVQLDNQELTETKQQLSQQLALKTQDLEQSQEQLGELQTQHEQTSACCSSLEGQLKLAQQEVSTQSSSLEALQSQAKDLTAAKSSLQGQLAQLSEEHANLQSLRTQGEEQCGALQAQLANQLEASEGLKVQLKACNSKVASQQQQCAGQQFASVYVSLTSRSGRAP